MDDDPRDPHKPGSKPGLTPEGGPSPAAPARSAFDPPSDDLKDGRRRRRLRAVLAADVAGFSGRVSIDETEAFSNLTSLRAIAEEELAEHDGWLFGMPGDGVFALFESAVDAVRCAMMIQSRIAETSAPDTMRFRIGLHAGEVLFENGIPFGETLAIAARLEALAEPGGILVSSMVADTASARVSATFSPMGVPKLKNIPRQIRAYRVLNEAPKPVAPEADDDAQDALDRTMRVRRSIGDVLPRETIDGLTAALALSLGPIASIVVERRAQRAGSLTGLIEDLAGEISSPEEQAAFRARTASLLAR